MKTLLSSRVAHMQLAFLAMSIIAAVVLVVFTPLPDFAGVAVLLIAMWLNIIGAVAILLRAIIRQRASGSRVSSGHPREQRTLESDVHNTARSIGRMSPLLHEVHAILTQGETHDIVKNINSPAYASQQRKVVFPELPIPKREPRRADIVAATILDEFSHLAWSYEFTLVPITPSDWSEILQSRKIDILLVESAWHGNGDAWQYHLAGGKAPWPALVALIEHCQTKGIPTVFWNKEDPPHFEDFIKTASLFDMVFTSDSNLVPVYRERLGHDRVDVLGFAAQEAIHNPIRLKEISKDRDVAFGGMYFIHKYPERRKQMDVLLGGALDASKHMKYGLEIFSRFQDLDDDRYKFPGELGERVVGSLSYPAMLTAYKAYKVFLNVNSVVDSPSMCSRRVFEIVASGTSVISTPSLALEEFFPDGDVPLVDSREDAAHMVRALVRAPELADRYVHRAQRSIWQQHTYGHRAQQVLAAAGIDQGNLALPSVSVVAPTNRPHQLRHLFKSVGRQVGVDVQLILVAHGFVPPTDLIEDLSKKYGLNQVIVRKLPPTATLGECLRDGINVAEGEIISKMDDDDLYGPEYLSDLLYAKRFSGADVVGKEAHYMHLNAQKATMLRFAHREHRWTDLVMGPTLTAARELFLEVPFGNLTRGEDTDWLRRASEAGARIYSSDRYNFVQVRNSGHTWDVTDRELLSTGDVQFFGPDPSAHVFV